MRYRTARFIFGTVWLIAGSLTVAAAQPVQPEEDILPPGTKELTSSIQGTVSDIRSVVSNITGDSSGLTAKNSSLKSAFEDLLSKNEKLKGLSEKIQVTESDTEMRISIESDVLFDFDRATIKKEAEPILQQLAEFIASRKSPRVSLLGFTDSVGSDAYNLTLSKKRAQSVKSWFVTKAKMKPALLVPQGLGEAQPREPNTLSDGSDNPGGRAKNRRVEVVIKK